MNIFLKTAIFGGSYRDSPKKERIDFVMFCLLFRDSDDLISLTLNKCPFLFMTILL